MARVLIFILARRREEEIEEGEIEMGGFEAITLVKSRKGLKTVSVEMDPIESDDIQ